MCDPFQRQLLIYAYDVEVCAINFTALFGSVLTRLFLQIVMTESMSVAVRSVPVHVGKPFTVFTVRTEPILLAIILRRLTRSPSSRRLFSNAVTPYSHCLASPKVVGHVSSGTLLASAIVNPIKLSFRASQKMKSFGNGGRRNRSSSVAAGPVNDVIDY